MTIDELCKDVSKWVFDGEPVEFSRTDAERVLAKMAEWGWVIEEFSSFGGLTRMSFKNPYYTYITETETAFGDHFVWLVFKAGVSRGKARKSASY